VHVHTLRERNGERHKCWDWITPSVINCSPVDGVFVLFCGSHDQNKLSRYLISQTLTVVRDTSYLEGFCERELKIG
jgi:hypothetical protein